MTRFACLSFHNSDTNVGLLICNLTLPFPLAMVEQSIFHLVSAWWRLQPRLTLVACDELYSSLHGGLSNNCQQVGRPQLGPRPTRFWWDLRSLDLKSDVNHCNHISTNSVVCRGGESNLSPMVLLAVSLTTLKQAIHFCFWINWTLFGLQNVMCGQWISLQHAVMS